MAEKSPKPSILDDSPDPAIPSLNEGFEGGFKIDTDAFKDNN